VALRLLDIRRAARYADEYGDDPEAAALLAQMSARKTSRDPEQERFAALCDRFDNLYYPNSVGRLGADHSPERMASKKPGEVHISLNVYPTYVDVPAALQAVVPVENIVTPEDPEDPESAAMAALAPAVERLYFAWKEESGYEPKVHKACVTKGLYGRTAAKVWWDDDAGRPEVRVIDQPRNLWLGWASTDYTRLEWALYVYRMAPESVLEEYGLEVSSVTDEDGQYPIVRPVGSFGNIGDPSARGWLHEDRLMVEVYDYWYRRPKEGVRPEKGKRTPMETCNAIFVGNEMVKHETHAEYDGLIPYVPLFNTYIPGVPDGRAELLDVEMLVREKEERLAQLAQSFSQAIEGQYWQLVGPEAPDVVPAGLERLKPNKVHGPGPGNRLEAIEPWMPSFQAEQYLERLDKEMVDVTGLNDLLRGLAPGGVMSSSKAITALVSNYETRISMKRDLLYQWRKDIWALVSMVWAAKESGLREVFEAAGRLEVVSPSLTPRDDLETATMARNLVDGKLWSMARGMDRVGVDDPEGEQDTIRTERTDAALNPADVLTMTSLMAAMQQLQMTAQQTGMGGEDASVSPDQAMAAQRMEGGPEGMPMMNGPEEQGMLPPEMMPQPGAGLPPSGPGENFLSQASITPEGANPRLLLQSPIAPEEQA
jgi:hypothetical protein